MNFLIITVCTFIAALYELLEWWVAIIAGSAAVAFLATQGDIWDTQWDIFLAIIGAVAALVLLRAWHDRQLVVIKQNFDKKGVGCLYGNSNFRT